jgi:hypothetical protein
MAPEGVGNPRRFESSVHLGSVTRFPRASATQRGREGLSLSNISMNVAGSFITMLWAVAHRREYRPVVPPEAGSATNWLHQEQRKNVALRPGATA